MTDAVAARVPLLGWDVHLIREANTVIVDAECKDFDLCFESDDSDKLWALLSLFDGLRSLAEAAATAGVSEAEARACAAQLTESGLAVDLNLPDSDLRPEDFVTSCRRIYPALKRRLFSHPLWVRLAKGEVGHPTFMGWLIENYHFIEGVNDRLSLAVAACRESRIRPFFAKHFTEEWDHAEFFLRALGELGVPRDEAMLSRPLPSTVAVLNHMRRSARRDALEYAACSGFLESTNEDRSVGVGFLDRLAEHYTQDRPRALRPLIDHLRLDEAYKHNTVLEDICSQIDRIPVHRASAAIGAAFLVVETMEAWSTDILRSYDRPTFVMRRGLQGHRPAATTDRPTPIA